MTEIVFSPPSARLRLRALQLAGLAAGALLIAAGLVLLRPLHVNEGAPASRTAHHRVLPRRARPQAPAAKPAPARPAPVPARATAPAWAGGAAAAGFDRDFFVAAPGGVFGTAERVARWRAAVEHAARRGGIDPDLLEAMVYVESGGRAGAIAGGDPAGRVGLTQLGARTAQRLLHVHVSLHASRVLTARMRAAAAAGAWWRVRRLALQRRAADRRFAARVELAATVRYLRLARRRLGRMDLAVASYHLGTATVAGAVRRWSHAPRGAAVAELAHRATYGSLYFGSAPDRHSGIWRLLSSRGTPARDYYWRVLAAERVMSRWRHDSGALAYEQSLQFRKNSAEEVLHPLASTARFGSPRALTAAWRHHVLHRIPRAPARTHVAVAGTFGQMAHRLGHSRRLYRGLREDALQVLLTIGRRVHQLSGARQPLIVTSAVRDLRYQRVLMNHNAMAARSYSLHTTGYAFDIARSYASVAQARAFQFELDRLTALHLIAYIVEPEAIHVAVASHAAARLRALRHDT